MTEKAQNNFLEDGEKIIELEIERLHIFKDYPFSVVDDEQVMMLKDSIERYGILVPLIVRPLPEGIYEIISGHRRKRAAELFGYRKVPIIIRVMRDKESVIAMVNAQSSPYLSQDQRLKELSKEGKLTQEVMEDVMNEVKKGANPQGNIHK